jgi:hypothetical protein
MKMKLQLLIPSLAIAAVCLAGTAFAKHPKHPAFAWHGNARHCQSHADFSKLPKPPTPSPENQLLAIWYGDWKYKGKISKTPLEPAREFSGVFTGRAILGGNASEFIGCEDGVYSYEIDFWDPTVPLESNNTSGYSYISMSGGDYEYVEQGTYQMRGTTCVVDDHWVETTEDGTFIIEYWLKGTEAISPDDRTITEHFTLSWDDHKGNKAENQPYFDETAIKVSRDCPAKH